MQADAITRALDELRMTHAHLEIRAVRKEYATAARAQLDALLAENADLRQRFKRAAEDAFEDHDHIEKIEAENQRLREALSDVVNACGNDGKRIEDDEFFKVMDRIASAHAKARALLAPEEPHG